MMIRLMMIGLTALSAAACVSVLPDAPPPAPRYGVSDVTPAVALNETVNWSLSVDDPQATRAVDTAKIARVTKGARYEYYSGGEWADRAPRLFQSALIRSFQNVDGVANVGSRATQPVADFILQTDIRAFQAARAGRETTADIKIYCRLTDIRGRTYAAKLFTATKPAADNAGEIAESLNNALAGVIDEIVTWSVAKSNAAHEKSESIAAS